MNNDAQAMSREEKPRRLTALTSLRVASNTINPLDYFKTRTGLWLENFNKLILPGVDKQTVSTDEATIGFAELVQAAYDTEIGCELPKGYVFEDADTFLAHLATLIEGQWGGKSGPLLNDEYSNIFFVKVNGGVLAVSVLWSDFGQVWYCSARYLSDLRESVGFRVFSATVA